MGDGRGQLRRRSTISPAPRAATYIRGNCPSDRDGLDCRTWMRPRSRFRTTAAGRAFQQPAEALAQRAPPDPDRTGGRCERLGAGICAFWKPAARSRAARWCSCSAARSTCRSRSATPCTSRRASCRPMATRDWRPTICSRCGRRWISFCGSRSRIPAIVIDGHWDVRMRNQGVARACSSRFASHTRWKPASPTTPCTSSSIPKACGSSS